MDTLIAYATKYGCAEKCAQKLSKKLAGKVDLYNIKRGMPADLSQYDNVVIGGSIYMGKIQKEVSEFCKKNIDELKGKKVGLFICCMREGEAAEEELNSSFPEELISCAAARKCFGGEFILNKMNFFDRMIVKAVSRIDKDVSNILEKNIDRLAQSMNQFSC